MARSLRVVAPSGILTHERCGVEEEEARERRDERGGGGERRGWRGEEAMRGVEM
jgi:hypothetical protein